MRSVEWAPVIQRMRGIGADVLLHAGYQNDILLLYRGMQEAGWMPRMVIGAGAGYSLTDTGACRRPGFRGHAERRRRRNSRSTTAWPRA